MTTIVGTADHERLEGTAGDDLLQGLAGEDALRGASGNDTLEGGADNDYFEGGYGNDLIDGGDGIDWADYSDIVGPVAIDLASGTATGAGGDDTLIGIERWGLSLSSDTFLGSAGDDDANGSAGNDLLRGLAGDDSLAGSEGNDTLLGGTGNDTYVVDSFDIVTELPDDGIDTLYSSESYDLSDTDGAGANGGNVENLFFSGYPGYVIDAVPAVAGTGNGLDNVISARDGSVKYRLNGGRGNDTLVGGWDNDSLIGGSGADHFDGGAGDDIYIVDSRGDRAHEDDVYQYSGLGDREPFVVTRPSGNDSVLSSVSWQLGSNIENLGLRGSAAINGTGNGLANHIIGNSGNNHIKGLAGDDALQGGAGSDSLSGGMGSDSLTGGAGQDRFVFQTALSATTDNVDLITDFTSGTDTIALARYVFAGIDSGLPQFRSGSGLTAAIDTGDRILYDTATGALYYDSDGTGSAAAIQFAVLGLTTHAVIKAADFVIVG